MRVGHCPSQEMASVAGDGKAGVTPAPAALPRKGCVVGARFQKPSHGKPCSVVTPKGGGDADSDVDLGDKVCEP